MEGLTCIFPISKANRVSPIIPTMVTKIFSPTRMLVIRFCPIVLYANIELKIIRFLLFSPAHSMKLLG